MKSTEPPSGQNHAVNILVTGTNSGLGFAICCRLIDDFLRTRPATQSLTIIFTTRSLRKGNETLSRLNAYLDKTWGGQLETKARVSFRPENGDLTNLLSVRALARKLRASTPTLDAVVLNAGLGGFTGLNWPLAIFCVLTDLVNAVTWPTYKLQSVGALTDRQTAVPEEPHLGQIFCANVFGHYMLAHDLIPLLSRSDPAVDPGRVIWVSSLEGAASQFDVTDIQGLRSPAAYESSKRLTDILALTSSLPSTAPWVDSFLSADNDTTEASSKPTIHVTHPGLCGTSIVPLAYPLQCCMLAAFFLARLLGSPWHVMSPYLGACAPVWLCLSSQAIIDAAESAYVRLGGQGCKAKWGSSCDRLARNAPASTEVDGWGYGGVVGSAVVEADRKRRRKRGAIDLTAEEKEEFVELGRKCWRDMEELRVKWEEILDKADTKE